MKTLKFYGKDHTKREEWSRIITEMEPFNAGSMSGRLVNQGSYVDQTGDLPAEYVAELRNGSPDYVVFSYATPIMWHDSVTGKWRFPRVIYSATTARQQQHAEYAVKKWNGERWITPDSFDDSGPRLKVDSHTDYLR